MAIGERGTASGTELNGADLTISLPVGTTTGDLVIVVVGGESADGNEAMAMTTSGYTLQAEAFANDNRDSNLGVFTKVMGGTPDTDVTITGFVNVNSVMSAIVYVATGVDTSTPIDVATPSPTTGLNGGNADGPSITPVTNGARVFSVFANTRSADTPTQPSGYSAPVGAADTDGTNRTRVGLAYLDLPTAAPENPGAWSNMTGGANDSWAAATLALRPAAGGSTYTLAADSASYSYSATAADLLHNRLIDADAASYAYTATAADPLHGWLLDADAAAYTWTAQDAGVEHHWLLDAASAAYAWTAADASLEYSAGAIAYNLDADSAAYLWSAADAELIYAPLNHYTLDADASAFLWNAEAAALSWSGAPVEDTRPTGGWDVFTHYRHRADALRRQREQEREELELTEQEQRRLDRAAVKIARRVAKEGLNADRPAVIAAPAFDAVLAALRPTEGQALALADAILQRILWMAAAQQADEEAALMALLAEL